MFSSHARSISIALIFVVAVFCPTISHAQQEPATTPPAQARETPAQPVPAHRPVIGVALAGGGALGLAHIGVLQWMEENHIPVDKVAGTSMGALVGAAFATGRNGIEMRELVKTIHWDDALLAEPSYNQLFYRRKQDRRDYQFGGELGFKHGFNGPNGFDPGHGVGLVLDRMSFAYSTISSFDDLPTPFRCVATDLLSGQAVVLHDGSLSRSLRASMAIPGVFTPQELNGKMLVDGGIVDNLPTDVVRQMNVDVVIAVDIVTQPPTATQFETVSGILTRTVDVMVLDNERRALQLADVVVSLDLGNLGAFDYDQSETIINLGYKAAAARGAALRAFALSDADWQTYVAEREARKRSPEKSAEILEVTGVSGDEQQHLEKRLQKTLHNDLHAGNLNIDELDARLTQIVGEGRFDRMGYEGFVQNGVPGLRVVAHEKSYGPPFVDLAVNVDGSGVAAFDVSGGARVTFMDIDHHGGEWRNDLLFGSSNLAATEFYQPLAMSRFFVAPFAFASKFARNSFTGELVSPSSATNVPEAVSISVMIPAAAAKSVSATKSSAANSIPSSAAPACPSSAATPANSACATSGTDRIAPAFPAAAFASCRIFHTCCRAQTSPIPSPSSTCKLPPSRPSAPRPRSSLSLLPAPAFTAPPDPSRFSRWAAHSISAHICRRNSSATTTDILLWGFAASYTACRSWSAEKSTGLDGTKPAPPSTIPTRWSCAAPSISASSPKPSPARSP